jgi:hypothetical protein
VLGFAAQTLRKPRRVVFRGNWCCVGFAGASSYCQVHETLCAIWQTRLSDRVRPIVYDMGRDQACYCPGFRPRVG